MRETIIYIFIGLSSLLVISYVPYMFLDGILDAELVTKIQVIVTCVWAIGLGFLGWDIVRKRRGNT